MSNDCISKADFSLIVSSVADWQAEMNKIHDSKYWSIISGGKSVGAKETIEEKSALGLNGHLTF